MTDMQKGIADKLREARTVIQDRGWYQGWYVSSAGCVCILGALHTAFDGSPCSITDKPKGARELLEKVVRTKKLHEWNDRKCRTQGDVLAAFDKAIELAEAQS